MTDTERVLAEVLADVVGFSGRVTDELAPATVPGWDSVAHIAIVEELESRFNVRFETEEMVEMLDVRMIKDVLAKHGVMDSSA